MATSNSNFANPMSSGYRRIREWTPTVPEFTSARLDLPGSSQSQEELSTANSASSLYSTDSAHSSDSTETTISGIIELYTDLADKIRGNVPASETKVLQPKAYLETVAPLLQRRFSSRAPTLRSASASVVSQESFDNSLQLSYKQAPNFQDFTRNLRERRTELVPPLSLTSSEYRSQPTLDSTSDVSPVTTPQMRPFSFRKSDNITESLLSGDDSLVSSPISPTDDDLPDTPNFPPTPQAFPAQQSDHNSYVLPSQKLTARPFNNNTKQSPDRHGFSSPAEFKPLESGTQANLLRASQGSHAGTERIRTSSADSKSDDSFVIYTGVGETVESMIVDKFGKKKERKEEVETVKSFQGQFEADDCIPAPLMPRLPRRGEKQAAIPLTPYQKYGAEIWFAKNKKKRREERQREKEASRSKESDFIKSQVQRRPKSHELGGRRKSSSKSSDTVLSAPSPKLRTGLMAALEGAKNSLTHTSAEKRREKIKESIVVLGPTQLTMANAAAVDARSSR